jgi:hypothetical protein
MEPIADLNALKPIVEGLLARRLMLELTPPGRGQIVSHNLYPPDELAEVRREAVGHGGEPKGSERAPAGESPAPVHAAAVLDTTAGTSAEIAELREEVRRLKERIQALEDRLGRDSP